MKLRGLGDFFGKKQYGLPNLKIADISSNMEFVHLTNKIADDIIEKDPELEDNLRVEVIRLFS